MHNVRVHMRRGLLCGALALSLGGLALGGAATFVAPAPAYAASAKKDGSLKGIEVQKKVDRYTWSELSRISDAIGKSGSKKAALKIAKKYKLCTKSGKLDGTQIKKVTTSSGEGSVRIVDFYHDDLADGSGKAGITWQFVNGMCRIDYGMSGDETDDTWQNKNIQLRDSALQDMSTGSYLPSDMVSRLATVSVKTATIDSAKNGEATSSDVKIWAPAATEVLGNAKKMSGLNRDSDWMAKALNAEGTQYKLFKDQGLTWKDQKGSFSDYPTSYLYDYGYTEDSYDDPNHLGYCGIYVNLKDTATPQMFDGSGTPDRGCVTVYRSLYLNPKDPDAAVHRMAAAIGQSGVAGCGRYTYVTGVNKVIQPLFCLTASADDASGSAESNGIAIKDNVDSYSWKELKAVANEMAAMGDDYDAAAAIAAKYHLGDEYGPTTSSYKTVKLKDGTTTRAYIFGYVQDKRSDGKGYAGLSFVFGDVAPLEAAMNKDGANAGGWRDSDLRRTLNKKFLSNLPNSLKKNIVKVAKLTNNTGVTTDASAVTTTDDMIWAPSVSELFGKSSIEQEGTGFAKYQADQVPVYEAEGYRYSLAFSDYASGSDVPKAWTRSCNASESGEFIPYQGSNGFDNTGEDASKSLAVFPGFCL